MDINNVKKIIRTIPDYPSQGIIFRDLTTIFKDKNSIKYLSDLLYETYRNKGITKVLGIESRGFIMGAILATKINAGFIPIRKKGKLPAEIFSESYEKEYGTDTLEIHKDALCKNDIVLIHDDILATGGTLQAAYKLVEKFHVEKIYVNFIAELCELNGRQILGEKIVKETISFIQF